MFMGVMVNSEFPQVSPQPNKTEKGKESETVVQVKELAVSVCLPSPVDGPGVDVLHVGGAGHLHQDNVPLPPPIVPLVSEDKRTDAAEKLTEEKDSCVPLVNHLQEQVAAEEEAGSEEKDEEEEILLVVDEALDEEVEREEKL